jgi:hypothetical protein
MALKQPGCPVTALALNAGGRAAGPGFARPAPGHPAAYCRRYTDNPR